MDDYIKLYKQVISTMERLEKAGTLEKFLVDVSPKPFSDQELFVLPYIDGNDSYKRILDHCLMQAGILFKNINDNMGTAKTYIGYIPKLYASYKKDEGWITNEAILKFIKDYEKDGIWEEHIDKTNKV